MHMRLGKVKKAQNESETKNDDPHLSSETLLILEAFNELKRNETLEDFDEAFQSSLASATRAAERFYESTESITVAAELRKDFDRLKKSCKDCHQTHRDSD